MFALDPDVLYLQSTPMTEPLLFGLVLLSISLVYDWVEVLTALDRELAPPVAQAFSPARGDRARAKAGWCLVLACLTRYEAWLVTAAVLVLATVALWRRGLSLVAALKATAHLAIYPVLAIVAFFFHSWFTTGAWFVTGGFFVPDNVATGNVWTAFMAVVYGMRTLIGTPFVSAGARGRAARPRARPVARRTCGVARGAGARCADGAAGVCVLQRPSVPHALHGCAVGRRGGVCRDRARHAERPLAPRRGRCDCRVARRDA